MKGGELSYMALAMDACTVLLMPSSYMALAMEREPSAYRSLLMVAGAVLAVPEPMPSRLARGCGLQRFTACVP